MKNLIKIMIILLFTIYIANLFSSPVNMETAKSVAELQLKIKHVENSFKVTKVSKFLGSNSENIAYITTLEPKGYIIVTGDTNLPPIISYSFKSNFYTVGDPNNILFFMLKKDLELRKKEIKNGKSKDIQSNIEAWNHFINKDIAFFNKRNFRKWPDVGNSVSDGFISTAWSLLSPYNSLCPTDPTTGKRCSVGSAAVTLAQIINYFKHLGNASFGTSDGYTTLSGINIDKDNTVHDFPSFTTLNNKLKSVHQKYLAGTPLNNEDIATICFASGVAVNMHYTSNGADSWTWDIAHALRNKFNFKKAKVYYVDSEKFYTNLQRNIKKKFPVDLLVDDFNEHSIICDGYNTDGEYHLNFGWAQKSKEKYTLAWYKLPTSLDSDYNIISQAIMNIGEGISPISNTNEVVEKIELDTEGNGSLIGFEEDESDTTSTKEELKSNVVEETVNTALDNENLPSIGTTNRFVIYEVAPVPIKTVPPVYPRFLMKRGIQGEVWLSVEVLADGNVGAVEVVQSLNPGKGGLDEAATKAVKKWKFEPAKSGGKSVAAWVKFPVTFSLQ